MSGRDTQEAAMNRQVPEHNSIPSGENTVWADVSPLLEAACKELRDGELIHGDNFNLFAAMSALEIMDPKMDSGIVCKYYSLDEAIEDGAAPVPISHDKTIDIQSTIDIMDHLLACEATWHSGHSLAQTVFSCIYLLRPDRTSSHAILHSYCRVIRATCKAVVSVVSDARTHEEEDVFTMTYGLPLNGNGDEKCLSMLNAVEETISRQLRACKAPSSKRRVLEDIEPLQHNLDLEEGFCKALLCRLRFRKHFFQALSCMRRPQGRGFELARKHIASCVSELGFILKSAEFLRSGACGTCEDGIEDSTTASGCSPIGFDASLNSRLSAPTPPRAIKILSWKKAVEYFVKLLHDLDAICSYPLDPSLEGVLRFVVQFQKSKPDLVARAHLQLLLVQDGKLYGRDPIFAVITKAAGLPELTKNHDIQKNEYIVQLVQLVINMLKILCTNAAWQRRKLGKILQDWRVICVQLEIALRNEIGEVSSILDDENMSVKMLRYILNWVEEQTYWIASRFLMLGFELDLYSPNEYCMVYWYLYVVLIKLAEKAHIRITATNGTVKRKGGKKKKDCLKEVAKESRIPPAILFLQCYVCLAEGLTMLLAALRNELMVLQSSSPFNTERERFIQHFELLQKACVPDHVSYPSFMESTTYAQFSTLAMYNYFKEAQRIAKEIKSSFSNDPDKLAELKRLEQIAEHNGVALNLICRVGALDPSLKVTFEFSHHPFFATAVVKRS
ncbi:N-alpha-acetyltransferase 35 NatC auxiliary subunit [Melia azedarach]|uniref:N-alpha-acetyltransferase 35 NatC auxiliary subunit n=1 Tax=Melia azedarach TaxID=155640 RepID=A0ACC1XE68_MELAZ|nr:N-alpha-acetyltransferase 35 NatC auxiliary subunit [Melia azedarach]